MRRRILVLVMSTTAFALVLLGVILMVVIWQLTSIATQARADSAASLVAVSVEGTLQSNPASVGPTPALIGIAQSNDAYITVSVPEATKDGRIYPAWTFVLGDPVQGGGWIGQGSDQDVEATAIISTSGKVAQVAGQGLIVLAIALVALGIATAVAWFYTRRLTQPFEDFKDFIASLSTGDRRGLKQRYGLPEVDMVAEVLDVGISRFDEMLERERQATQDASHQLKSPLTAISMRLEEITTTDDLDVAREEAAIALGQVERLAGVVDEVVGVMRGQRSSMPVDFAIDDMVQAQVTEWLPAYRAAGRGLQVSGREGIRVHAEIGAQAQALAALLENSLAHGAGVTTVRVRQTSGWAVVEVADQGEGVAPELEATVFDRTVSGARSSGLGLAVARTLVSGDGGRLELISARPAVFAIFLPAMAEAAEQPVAVDSVEQVVQEPQAVVEIAASSAASTSSGNTQRR